jgi:Helix-turn-helix domain
MEKLKMGKDRTPAALRKLAKIEGDVRVARSLLAIANALCGMSRAEAAASAGIDRQTLRDWVIRYNEHGVTGLGDVNSTLNLTRVWRCHQFESDPPVSAASSPAGNDAA